MKKVLTLLLSLAVCMATLNSCDENPFVLDYDAAITGDCDGNFNLNVPTSETDVLVLNLNGDADCNFHYGKPSQALRAADCNAIYKDGVKIANPSKKEKKIAAQLRQNAEDQFTATAISGTYYVHIVAHITETTTGISATIDKVLTNRENVTQ